MHPITAPNRCDPARRIAGWHAFLRSARRIFVPSMDTRRRLTEAFPDVEFLVRAHEEELEGTPTLAPPEKGAPLRLVTIGAIGPHKGADLIYSLALDARTRELPMEYHVVGYTSIDTEMKAVGVTITGLYSSIDESVAHLQTLQPSYALLPSIWPETYCYTLSVALAIGLPPIVFDLGAQADRLRAEGFGVILDPKLVLDPKAINDMILGLSVADEWAKRKSVSFRHYEDFPAAYYELGESSFALAV